MISGLQLFVFEVIFTSISLTLWRKRTWNLGSETTVFQDIPEGCFPNKRQESKFTVNSKPWQKGSSPAFKKALKKRFFGLPKSFLGLNKIVLSLPPIIIEVENGSKGKMSGLSPKGAIFIHFPRPGFLPKNTSKKTQAPSNHSLQRQGFQVAWYRRGSYILRLCLPTRLAAVWRNLVIRQGSLPTQTPKLPNI